MPDDKTFTPKLTTTDWNAEWMELQKVRGAAGDAEHWNERAKTFHRPIAPSLYTEMFIEFTDALPRETIFDMGCGTGAISIPLAEAGHHVIAADFSEGMIAALEETAEGIGDLPIETKLLSWADDWEHAGISQNCVDVACASRSIATSNMRESLEKLSRVARRRCAVTLPTGSSPRIDENIMQAIGLQRHLGRDFVYAIMILIEMGYFPEVRYIPSSRYDTYSSEEDAFESLKKMVIDASSDHVASNDVERALANLRRWLDENLVANPSAGKKNMHGEVEGAWRLKEPRKTTWAHIAWNV